MMVSKTTTNFAGKRGIELSVDDFGNGDQLCIWEADNDCEWMCSYLINNDGFFTWHGNIYLADEIKEELPATIKDEKHLREVIAFIASEIKK
ncbi:hypothetical protein [Escherichia phage vB_EcoS_PHB17]|uniref:Uncharacterized protein n=1 Tax=Escherichia phage vB_EcoS_PHB17 TaxID=2591407 RepID=A0A514DKT7_9CAUD|nr:hypothetical protein KMB84_gp85 [Escherichia phage vB_EcoS_PHB17]QDH94288.1 hypothetical protein [Escherichia phage vB_EcoS_PHB17]